MDEVLTPVTINWILASNTMSLTTTGAQVYQGWQVMNMPRLDLKNSKATHMIRAVYTLKTLTFGTLTEVLDFISVLQANILIDGRPVDGLAEDFASKVWEAYADDPDRISVDMDQIAVDYFQMQVLDTLIGTVMGKYAKWQKDMGIWLPASRISEWYLDKFGSP